MKTRNNTAYASAYQRDRVHVTRLFAYEKERLTADFNGALGPDESIASATWQTQYINSALMSDVLATARETSILIGSQYTGPAIIKCTATLTDGQKRVQQFCINVQCQPYYQGDTWTSGPLSLTATV
jgi:hypothetical protein